MRLSQRADLGCLSYGERESPPSTGEDVYLRHVRRRQQEQEQDDEEEAGATASQSPAAKRRRKELSEDLKRKREQLLVYYSEKSGFGKPSALLLHHLARNMGLDKTMSLW